MNRTLQFFSTEIVSRNKLPEIACSLQNELATDFSIEVKSLHSRMPKLACNTKRKDLVEKFFSVISPSERMFSENFNLSKPNITDNELQHLLTVLLENNVVLSNSTCDVGKITQEIHVKLKKYPELRKQRRPEVPLHYRNRLEIHLIELQRPGIIRDLRSDVEMGSVFTNTIFTLPKRDTVKLAFGAQYLNPFTDLSNYLW